MGSAEFKRERTGRISPTSVQACKFRTLFRRIAMKMLQISAYKNLIFILNWIIINIINIPVDCKGIGQEIPAYEQLTAHLESQN